MLQPISVYLKDNPYYKKGLESFEKGEVKIKGVPVMWVKKGFTAGEMELRDNTYCRLEEEGVGKGKRIMCGFPIVGVMPDFCEPCTDEDLRRIDLYRRANHLAPTPLEDVII